MTTEMKVVSWKYVLYKYMFTRDFKHVWSMFEVCLKYEKNTRDPILVKSQRVNEINESTI